MGKFAEISRKSLKIVDKLAKCDKFVKQQKIMLLEFIFKVTLEPFFTHFHIVKTLKKHLTEKKFSESLGFANTHS